MREVMIGVPEDRLNFFKELIAQLVFVELNPSEEFDVPLSHIEEVLRRQKESKPQDYTSWESKKPTIDPYDVRTSKKADNDIQKAIKWYNQQRFGLGAEFYEAITSSLLAWGDHPFYQIRCKTTRCLKVSKYPLSHSFCRG